MHCKLITSVRHEQKPPADAVLSPENKMNVTCMDENMITILQTTRRILSSSDNDGVDMIQTEENQYVIHVVGPPKDVNVVDTTGSGDAFAGGYIFSKIHLSDALDIDASAETLFHLRFASWVAGRKIQGAGARHSLPRREEAEHELGCNVDEMRKNLRSAVCNPRL